MTDPAATNEPEAVIDGPLVNGFCDYGSVLFDLLRIKQLLDSRAKLPAFTDQAPEAFTRAALWDAAVVAYGRCFGSGTRPTNMDQLVKQLPTESRSCHDQILTTRHKEVAHHDWPRQGKVLACAIFDPSGAIAGIRLRLFPIMGPEVDPPLAALVSQLATLVDLKLQQLQQRIVAGPDVTSLAGTAQPHDSRQYPYGRFRLTYDTWLPSISSD